MMKENKYKCPNCGMIFDIFSQTKEEKLDLILDKKYSFDLYNIYCENCKKTIRILESDIIVAWDSEYEFSFEKYTINKNINIKSNKKYFYFYYPNNDKYTVQKMFKKINKDNISCLIIPEKFHDVINFSGETCVLPNQLFYYNNQSIFPNYLAEKIIINESNKHENSELFSCYNTFFYKFNLLYNVLDWKKLIKKTM